MNLTPISAVLIALFALPAAAANAENVRWKDGDTITQSTTVKPTYRETKVLKGYKVTTHYPAAGSAPVAGETHNTRDVTFVPADDPAVYDSVPPAEAPGDVLDTQVPHGYYHPERQVGNN